MDQFTPKIQIWNIHFEIKNRIIKVFSENLNFRVASNSIFNKFNYFFSYISIDMKKNMALKIILLPLK